MQSGDDNESGLVNSMTRREIIFFIADAKKIDDPCKLSPGRRKQDRPKVTQRRFRITADGDMFLNRTSFSWTKSTTGIKNGYPTMPLRTRKAAKSESGSSPPKQEKAPSFTRVLVHSVMWRFWNGFQKIPTGMEVSHLSGVTAVGKPNLCVESGVRNKHRIGCHGKTILGESCKCGVPDKGIPNCRLVQEPDDSFFDLTDEEKAARDEKAALKVLPSSGEDLCEVCLCVKNRRVNFDECSTQEVLDFCLCSIQDAAQK